MNTKKVTTKKDEVRLITSDPNKMINMYLAKDLVRTWAENFVDTNTGETAEIPRSELIAEKGRRIDRELLSSINFYLQSNSITEVEVSNQRRNATFEQNEALFPWFASAKIDGKTKKILLYAPSLPVAVEILTDYIELNFTGTFHFTQIKEYGDVIILRDNLKAYSIDEAPDVDSIEEENFELKFYQIEVSIDVEGAPQTLTFVVETKDTAKAMIVITSYMNSVAAEECDFDAETLKLETAKILACNDYIDKEFSEAYV